MCGKREYVIGIIKRVYESYGFEPLETPAVENIETLMGKYGEEGNQLIFKILKRGEKLRESLESGVTSLDRKVRLKTPDSTQTPDSPTLLFVTTSPFRSLASSQIGGTSCQNFSNAIRSNRFGEPIVRLADVFVSFISATSMRSGRVRWSSKPS